MHERLPLSLHRSKSFHCSSLGLGQYNTSWAVETFPFIECSLRSTGLFDSSLSQYSGLYATSSFTHAAWPVRRIERSNPGRRWSLA